VGNYQAARAVGNALANNPFPIIVPCHRAIRSDGHLGGFQGGFHMKKVLLENEGVKTDEKGRVINPSWYYKVD
jgi:methylated-DNA-[protein]-cysteine S-methyltransferase